MLRGLQLGFGEPVGVETAQAVSDRKFTLARLGCGRTSDVTRVCVDEARTAGLRPLLMLESPYQMTHIPLDGDLDVEYQNEPNIGTCNGGRPIPVSRYLDELQTVYGYIKNRQWSGQPGIRLWAGALSNFDSNSFRYLEELEPHLPPDVGISMHWYPGADPRGPHKGFQTRREEVEALKALIGSRRWGISETGWTTGRQNARNGFLGWLFPKWVQWNDQEVAATAKAEFAWWEEMGATFACLYQINDGGDDTPINRFGIRRIDGGWKPVANIWLSPAETIALR